MARRKTSSERFDSLYSMSTGRGSAADKIEGLLPNPRFFTPQTLRDWYLANGFIQNAVNAPAEDATREWITIKTNRDTDNEETGEKGLNLSRDIINRMTELGLQKKICELIKYSRMYNMGGFMFYGIKADAPQTDEELRKPLPGVIRKIDFINVFGPDRVSVFDTNTDPLSKLYHRKRFNISGTTVHPSRIEWMVRNYLEEEKRGVSVIDTILDGIRAQDTALWSTAALLFELAVKIFKSPDVQSMPPDKLAETVGAMKAVMSTQSMVALTDKETLERLSTNGELNGVKNLFDFIFENLAGLSNIPKSRLMGNSQGVITAGQYDLLSYYDTCAKFQELEVRPIIERTIKLIINETEGTIFRKLNGNVESLDWEFTFNPLWKLAPADQADVDLKNAQENQIYVTIGSASPDEVRKKRFRNLEDFGSWEKKASLDLKKPPQPEVKTGKNPENADTAKIALLSRSGAGGV